MFEKKWPGLKKRTDRLIAHHLKVGTRAQPPSTAPPGPPALSPVARQILIQAETSARNTITMNKDGHGFNLNAGERNIVSSLKDERREAELRAAMGELESLGLIADKGHKREVFGITQSGYTVAGELKKLGSIGTSVEAKTILLAASAGKDGQIMHCRGLQGTSLSVGGRDLCASDDDRVIAAYDEALKDLVGRGLLKVVDEDNHQITGAGYRAAEELRQMESV